MVETRPFMRAAADWMTDGDREDLIEFIARDPTAGALIQGAGGIRKVRWAARGRGKRGGLRVIYYYHSRAMPLFLLTVYGKSKKDDITATEKKVMKQLVRRLVRAYRNKLAGRKAET